MPINLFKSRKSTPKGNTIKKADLVDGCQARRNFYDVNNQHIADISTVSNWMKESTVVNSEDSSREGRAVLKGPKGPLQVELVNGDTAKSKTHSQEAIREESDSVSSTQSAVNGQTQKVPHREMLDLLIGQRDPSSQYFTQRYIRVPASTMPSTITDNNSLLAFPELDPQAMELYQIWFHTGEIPARYQRAYCPASTTDTRYSWQTYWPLINAHILGCALKTPEFSDQVIDLLQEKLSIAGSPDVDTIDHLFSASNISNPETLKNFIVDRCINAGIDGLAGIDMPSLPLTFVYLMLERSLCRLSSTSLNLSTSECEYHTHKSPETCYKQSMLPKDLRRKQGLELDRENSCKDAQEVVMNAKVNGIKTVDWEERRAEANRALWEQTGRRHFGFRRQDGLHFGLIAARDGERLPDVARTSLYTHKILDTAQTYSAVENGVVNEALPYKTPSLPSIPELPVGAVHVKSSAESLSEYKATAPVPENDDRPIILGGCNSLALSSTSTRSKLDADLREHLEMDLELERKLECPGAFPVSRNGSERSSL
jgi:hypothetical protein